MTDGIRIGRIFGIDIAINPTWFIVLVLVIWSLAGGVFPNLYRWSTAAYWGAAIVAALLLFASVLVHELAHSLVARAQGTPVRGITLFLLGGVSAIERDASSPGREALMAGAGPLTSLVLGGIFWVAGLAVQLPETVHAVLLYLGVINVALAAFNLIPGFPLDGGRLLRAGLWGAFHSFRRATRWATWAGIAVGYLMIGFGVYMAYTGSIAGGIWIGFVGWMLILSARASWRQEELQARLERIPVVRMMRVPDAWVAARTPLAELTHEVFTRSHESCLPVMSSSSEFEGVVCRRDIEEVGGDGWHAKDVGEVMRAAKEVPVLPPDASLAQALDSMAASNMDELAIVRDGTVIGFVDRARVERYAKMLAHSRGSSGGADRRRGRRAPGTAEPSERRALETGEPSERRAPGTAEPSDRRAPGVSEPHHQPATPGDGAGTDSPTPAESPAKPASERRRAA